MVKATFVSVLYANISISMQHFERVRAVADGSKLFECVVCVILDISIK